MAKYLQPTIPSTPNRGDIWFNTENTLNIRVQIYTGDGWQYYEDLFYNNPGSGSVSWGGILGTLSTQTDLSSALDSKASSAHSTSHINGADQLTDVTTDTHGLMIASDKSKLDGVAAGAEVNINADWNSSSGDSQILNKPSTMPPSSHGNSAHTSTFITQSEIDSSINTHKAVTTSVHGFDASGNAPAQSHDNTKHGATYITSSSVTYANLNSNNGIGTGANQVLPSTVFVGLTKITIGTSQPGSPNVGDLWVDTN